MMGAAAALLPTTFSAVILIGGVFAFSALIAPLTGLIILLALAPLRTLIATESTFNFPLDVGQIALLGFISVWTLQRAVRRDLRLHRSPVLIAALIFTAIAGATVINAFSVSAWLNEWLKWAQIALLIVICLDLKRWQWLVFALVTAGAANAVIGVYQYFGGSGALHLLIDGVHFRAFGTFGQPNPFGGFMGLIAPLAAMSALGAVYQLWSVWRSHRKIAAEHMFTAAFYGAAALLIVAALIMSWSRGAWLGLAVSFTVMLFALPRRVWIGLAFFAVAVLAVGGLWLTGRLPASVVSRIESATLEILSASDVRGVNITPENYANVERLAHWQAAVNMATDYPWLGVGFGNYEIAYPRYNLISWQLALGHAHNYYLNVLAEAGIIGLIGYVGFWMIVLMVAWRARRHPDLTARLSAIGLLGSFMYLSVHSLTDNLYVNNLFLHVGVLLGILALLDRQTWSRFRLRTA